MTLTYISYEDQLAVMEGRMTLEDAQRRAAERLSDIGALPACCPRCGGEMQPYDDGEYTSRCEDCGWVRP